MKRMGDITYIRTWEGGLPGVSRTVVDCVGQAALLLLTKSCSASLGVRYPSAE